MEREQKQLKWKIETHSHTVASGHAYSTMLENAKVAAERGMEILCITDHGPAMADSAHIMHFKNFRVLERTLLGVEMMYGAELNILDFNGTLDIEERIMKMMDYIIVGFHPVVIAPGSRSENTRATIGAINNPHISTITHPEDGYVPIDYEAVVKEAVRCNVLIELNNNSLKTATFRLNVRENLITILKLCEKYGAMVSLGSDAHFASAVGDFTQCTELLDELRFPDELIINASPEMFRKHVNSKR